MNTPNIFDYATSELSQDAVLAYILKWADPEYHSDNQRMNKLGEHLLRELLNKVKCENIDKSIKIEKLCVKTQDGGVDVSVEINDKIFLIIEDKTNTGTHSEQIKRYKEKKEKNYEGKVVALYLKTGNESKAETERNSKNADGKFLREDLLRVLEEYREINNNIAGEFYYYLKQKENDTQSFQMKEFSEWQWEAHQGYCRYLEEQFSEGEVDWDYVANPAGGSLVFWWNTIHNMKDCKIYLQIDHRKGLFIRASEAKDNNKVRSDLQWRLLEEAKHHAGSIDGIEVAKPGRFGSGGTASFAKLYFDGEKGTDGDSYMAKKEDGLIDLPRTVKRLEKAKKLVFAMCNE